MNYKAIIIDDEKMARTLLADMLTELHPEIKVCESCEDLPSGVKAIRKHKPDLVFLDIEMPGHSGLELLDFFEADDIAFSIIFTTAYNQYAIQAFKMSAIDYLLKPISAEELEESINRFKKLTPTKEHLFTLKENLKHGLPEKIAISMSNAIKFIDIKNIIFFKADGAYTQLFLNDGSSITSSKSLKHFEEMLEFQVYFMRCHKSFLINLAYVTDYVRADGGHLVLNQTHEVSISNEKAEEFMRRMTAL